MRVKSNKTINELAEIDFEKLPLLLDEYQAAAVLNLKVSKLRQLRTEKLQREGPSGPKFIKLGTSVKYYKEDLISWVKEITEKSA